MSKTAFVFPGQGSQYVGMGRDFHDHCPESAKVYALAEQVTNLPIKALCFEANDCLNVTEYTQICLLTTELAILEAIKAKMPSGYLPSVCAGLSLGEYAALVCAGKLDMAAAMTLVRKRGIYMQEVVPEGGAMSAVLGLDASAVEHICSQIPGIVELANYNCPGQIVISGEERAVLEAGEALRAAGAKKVAPLKVSGPFHSSMLAQAGKKLNEALEGVAFTDSTIPYVSNTTAQYVYSKDEIRALLVGQISSGVRWEQSIRRMIADGVDTFIEIGPGKTLCGFLKRIDRSVLAMNVDKYDDLERLQEKL